MPIPTIQKYRQFLADAGVSDDRDDFFVLRDFIGPLGEKNPELFAQDPELEQQWRQIREANSPGTIGGIVNTAKSAFDRSVQAKNVIGTPDEVDVQDIADREKAIQARPSSVPYEDWNRSTGSEAVKTFLRDPVEITSNIVASGFAGSVPALAGGMAGGAAGAAAGSAVPGIGNLAGGTIGAALGTGAGSLAVEYGSKYLDVLREAGADLADPESILRVVNDPEIRARAVEMGLRRGLPVAIFDAASAGLAGKFVKGLKAGATTGQKVVAGVKEALAQGAAGGGGEIAGAVSAGEPISPGAVFEEVIGELGPGAVEVGGSAARSRLANPTISPAPNTTAPAPNTTLPTPNIGAQTTNTPQTPNTPLPVAVNEAFIETPAAPAATPGTRSNVEIVTAVEALLPEQKIERFTELSALPARSLDQETELELLRAEVPRDLATNTETMLRDAAQGYPIVENGARALANPVPASPEPAATVATEITPSQVSTEVLGAPASPATTLALEAEPAIQYTIQRPQVYEGRNIPGFVQVERTVDARGEPLTEAERAQFPAAPEWLPTGQYSLQQVQEAIKAGPPQLPTALATEQPKPSEMRPDVPAVAEPAPSAVDTMVANPELISPPRPKAAPLGAQPVVLRDIHYGGEWQEQVETTARKAQRIIERKQTAIELIRKCMAGTA